MASSGDRQNVKSLQKGVLLQSTLQLKVASQQHPYIYLLYFNTILSLLGSDVEAIPWLRTNRHGGWGGKGGQLRGGLGRKGASDKIPPRLPIGREGYDKQGSANICHC